MAEAAAAEVTLEGLAARLLETPPGTRCVLAIAGPPGSGKSTTAARLVEALEAARPGAAALVPMDGFHYDDAVLHELDRHARKGAPDTFDVGGLRSVLERLRARDEDWVAVPVFDRDTEMSRAAARLVRRTADLIVVEGNYLLLNRDPWASLRRLFDLRVLIEVPEAVLRARLEARWRGYRLAPAAIRAKVEGNDLPNGRIVATESLGADLVLRG
ncbi:MAG: nucleoside/nucleotide kinase family protein [Rhodobacteraceae bacterium]|nr:nucleoside/nucleotide kinase family protein [Paracoccaceae bacterium]